MKKIVNEYKKIRAGNIVTTNLLYILDKKGISNSNDKIKDYAKYLDERTNISMSRIKKMLQLNIKKRITINDLSDLAKALDVSPGELLKEID